MEFRTLKAVSVRGFGFPHAKQVFTVQRSILSLDGAHRSVEIAYGVTSLAPAQADAARLLGLVRGHWQIENRLHWVRDVTLTRTAPRSAPAPRSE